MGAFLAALHHSGLSGSDRGRLMIDRVQSTFYSGVNEVHRASVKLS